jgi:hypothetical protein
MLTRPLLLALTALHAVGCTHTIAVRQPLTVSDASDIDDLTRYRSVLLVVDGDQSYSGEVRVGPTETHLLDRPADDTRRSVPTAALRQIRWVDRGAGALHGLGFGLLGGAASGALVGAVVGSVATDPVCGCGKSFGAGLGALIGTGIGFLAGGVVGLAVGAVRGSETTIDLAPP